MDKSLLQTKFYIPVTRSDPATSLGISLVPRPRLIQQLDESLSGKLTLISAPAGFGKTTLISDWLQQINLHSAWLSLDADDNDFARFFNYLIAALQTIQPEIGTDVSPLLQASPLPHSHTLLTLLINDLTAISEEFILVLDDYHTIENEAIDQALDFFIEHLPPRMHLVMTSRVDPNLSLPRLRANGQLKELRSVDLRFTPAESAQFLSQMTELSLTKAEVEVLDRRTEGWVAGLQMAALSLRQQETASVAQFIEDFSGSHRYVMDYLVDEVLQGQPATVHTFLLSTSILDKLCGPLCEAILGVSEASDSGRDIAPSPVISSVGGAQALLEYLERANLFITPLDDQRRWYRYHPLFADLLRQRLQQTYPDQVAKLHLSASEWYEQAGLIVSAVQHTLAAQAFGRAAMLVEQVASAMIQRSELSRLLSWLGTLPEDELQARPLLALYYAWGLFLSGQIEQAAAHLDAIDAMLTAGEAKRTNEVQGHIAAMRAYLIRENGDLAAAIDLSRQAIANLPEENALLRAMVRLNLAIAHYLQGELDLASKLLTENIASGQTVQLLANTLSAIYFKAQILRTQGALQQALQICQEGLELVARHKWQDFPAAGFLYVTMGDLLRERNELPAAAEYLERGIELGQEGGHLHILIIGYVSLAWLHQTQGDVSGSQEVIRAALQVIQDQQVSPLAIALVSCCQARLWIAQGNLITAELWAQTSGLNLADVTVSYLHEVEYLTLARLWIAQGKLETAETLLMRLHREAATGGRIGSLIEILILQALICTAQKRSEEALLALGQALDIAEPEGYVRVFLDEGVSMAELLRQAVAQDLHASYALRLMEAFGETVTAPQPLVEPLSDRELEVLLQIAAGYSNKEIAQELFITTGTVKKHIGNIYGKLEVGNRTQAVAKAREIGLL